MNGLPTFIGIGATKSGSSWLYSILASHHDVYAPVKEVNYFTLHRDKGIEWYKNIFAAGKAHKQIGEMTPTYLYHEDVATQIAEQIPTVKLLVILRNPAYRAYSQYKTDFYIGKTSGKTFDEYLNDNPLIVERGFYSQHLESYLERIPKSQIKVFILEEAIAQPNMLKEELATFLDIDPLGFDDQLISGRKNVSDAPKFRRLYQTGVTVARYLHRTRWYRTSKFVKRTGSKLFKHLGESNDKAPEMSKDCYKKLMSVYAKDMEQLEKILGRNKPVW